MNGIFQTFRNVLCLTYLDGGLLVLHDQLPWLDFPLAGFRIIVTYQNRKLVNLKIACQLSQ